MGPLRYRRSGRCWTSQVTQRGHTSAIPPGTAARGCRAVLRSLRIERADPPVASGKPRLVHAV